MRATCQKAPDGRLLSQVSYLSGSIWHPYPPDDELFHETYGPAPNSRPYPCGRPVLAACGGAPAVARDHDEARRAVEAGEIRPLADILMPFATSFPGEVVGVKLERERGAWVYEFRVVDDEGAAFRDLCRCPQRRIERTKEK